METTTMTVSSNGTINDVAASVLNEVASSLVSGIICNPGGDGVKVYVSKSIISLRRLYVANFQKEGTLTAELEQVITIFSEYPSIKVENSLNQTFAPISDFGLDSQKYERKEVRIAWVNVPSNYTEDKTKQLLEEANKAGATLYKILSNQPVLTGDQNYSISIGQRKLEDFAKSQVVRYPKGALVKGEDMSGKLILDQQKHVQYRRINFWGTPKDDIDNRYGKSTIYVPAEIAAELEGASDLEGQKL